MKFVKIFLIFFILILFTACHGSNDNEGSNNSSKGTAQLGNLADANVSIFKIENKGSFTLLWNEKTSNGDTLDKIGKFNTHSNELNNDDYYLYKIVGGKDWDSDDNGIKDNNYTENKGVIRLIAKGSDIKKAGNNLRVTFASELVYEKVIKYIKYNFNKANFQTLLNENIKKVIKDVNNNGNVDIQDMIQFNPTADKDKLSDLYKIKISSILNVIHKGKVPFLNISNILGSIDTNGTAYAVTLSSDGTKAYVADGNNGLVIIDLKLFK
jgi:hypothetical protein